MTVAVPGVAMSPEGDSAWRAQLADRDEDGELWDASGRLVARFRQLAMILPPG